MSQSIEKYAEQRNRRRPKGPEYKPVPARLGERLPKIERAGAVLWDVYGTLVALPTGDLESVLAKKETMYRAFRLTAKEFGFEDSLDCNPAETLLEWYVQEIQKTHRRKRAHGVFSPEVKIEQIWLRLLNKISTRGYKPCRGKGPINLEMAYRVAYFFDDVCQDKFLYPGVRQALEAVRKLGLRQGIISNAQFYTPIKLNLLLRRNGHRNADPMNNLFDRRIVLFSYRLGVSKPNLKAFERARDRLRKIGIGPERVLYVGNDVLNDMIPARKVGFKSVLFAGDRETLNLRKEHPECAGFEPDAAITSIRQILKIIS